MAPIKIQFTYSADNLQRANRLHYKMNYPVRGKILLWFGVILIWTGLLFFYFNHDSGNYLMSYTFLAYGAIVICLHFYIMATLGKRLFRRHKNRVLPMEIHIDDEKVFFKAEENQAAVQWKEIMRACIGEDVVLLYITKMSFYIFPKENFSGNDFETFTTLVKEKVKEIK